MNRSEVLLREGGFVTGLRPLAGGRSNWVFRGRMAHCEREVVLKIARDQGQRVSAEHAALKELEALGAVVPRLVGLDAALRGQEWVTCLIQDLLPGRRPRSTAGIRRLGASLAALSRTQVDASGLPQADEVDLLHQHAQTRSTLGCAVPILPERSSHERSTEWGLVHGDPSPRNHLDQRAGGTWIDLETAAVGPLQLDLGRAALTVAMEAPRLRRRAWTWALLEGYS